MSKRQVLKTAPKFPNEERTDITHVPIEEIQVKKQTDEDSKTDEADIREFTSNSDAYDAWEYEDTYEDYLK